MNQEEISDLVAEEVDESPLAVLQFLEGLIVATEQLGVAPGTPTEDRRMWKQVTRVLTTAQNKCEDLIPDEGGDEG